MASSDDSHIQLSPVLTDPGKMIVRIAPRLPFHADIPPATSNAPHKPRKRRLSTSEQDDAISNRRASVGREGYVGESATKRARGERALASGDADEFGAWSAMPQVRTDHTSPEPQVETQDVKEVTQGVKEVELEDKVGVEVEAKDKDVVGEEDKDKDKDVAVEVEDNDKDKDDASSRGEEEQLPADDVEPESVPLPYEDEVDELDDDDDGSLDDGEEETAPDPEDAG